MVLESASNTSCTGTPSDIAFSRSTSTLSCGTVGRKNELMPLSCGCSRSAPRKLRHLVKPRRIRVGARLEIHLEAACRAETADRRRVERDDETVAQRRALLRNLRGDGRGRQ